MKNYMKGVCLKSPYNVEVRTDLPTPSVADDALDSVLVRVQYSALCGSDLHVYRGDEGGPPVEHTVLGHEAVGVVIQRSHDLHEQSKLQVGTQVIVPFSLCCGRCEQCMRKQGARCERSTLLGWDVDGCQAQLVLVCMASSSLTRVPADVPLKRALLLSDVIPTAFHAATLAEVCKDKPCLILGLGTVGLCAVIICKYLGASRVLAYDPNEYRMGKAVSLGATAFDPSVSSETFDSILECVGGSSPDVPRLAYKHLNPCGSIGSIGVPTSSEPFPISGVELYEKNVRWSFGRCSAKHTLDELLERHPQLARVSAFDQIFSHEVSIDQVPESYVSFEKREPGYLKIAIKME